VKKFSATKKILQKMQCVKCRGLQSKILIGNPVVKWDDLSPSYQEAVAKFFGSGYVALLREREDTGIHYDCITKEISERGTPFDFAKLSRK